MNKQFQKIGGKRCKHPNPPLKSSFNGWYCPDCNRQVPEPIANKQ